MKIEVGKKYRDTEGDVATIVVCHYDSSPDYPFLGIYQSGGMYRFDERGGSAGGKYRLVAEYRDPREFWINAYKDGDFGIHTSRIRADAASFGRDKELIHVREVMP